MREYEGGSDGQTEGGREEREEGVERAERGSVVEAKLYSGIQLCEARQYNSEVRWTESKLSKSMHLLANSKRSEGGKEEEAYEWR